MADEVGSSVCCISRLPPELWFEIFDHFLEGTILEKRYRNFRMPLVLGQICHFLRVTALSMPRLWSQWEIGDDHSIIKRSLNYSLLQNVWIPRSKGVLVSFKLLGMREKDVLLVLDALIPLAPRWLSAEFAVHGEHIQRLGPVAGRVSHLELLAFDVATADTPGAPWNMFEHAPQLRSVRFGYHCPSPCFEFPWENLEELDDCAPYVFLFGLALAIAPKLRRYTRFISHSGGWDPSRFTGLVHEHLQALYLWSASDGPCMTAAMALLTAPRLTTLVLNKSWGLDVEDEMLDMGVLLALVERSHCHLETLSICLLDVDEAALAEFLASPGMDSLIDLTFTSLVTQDPKIGTSLFTRLAYRSVAEIATLPAGSHIWRAYALPRLQRFTYRPSSRSGTDYDTSRIDTDALVRMVNSRIVLADAGGHSPARLLQANIFSVHAPQVAAFLESWKAAGTWVSGY